MAHWCDNEPWLCSWLSGNLPWSRGAACASAGGVNDDGAGGVMSHAAHRGAQQRPLHVRRADTRVPESGIT